MSRAAQFLPAVIDGSSKHFDPMKAEADARLFVDAPNREFRRFAAKEAAKQSRIQKKRKEA